MKFDEALKCMKDGAKVKLPSWGGYWCWDHEKQTIMIHCRPQDSDKGQRPVLDIRETQRVEYTLSHILREDWEIATSDNCALLGGVNKFKFSDALEYMKRGLKVKRLGWNGKGIYVRLYTPSDPKEVCTRSFLVIVTTGLITDNPDAPLCVVPWHPSQTDILAEDWVFVD